MTGNPGNIMGDYLKIMGNYRKLWELPERTGNVDTNRILRKIAEITGNYRKLLEIMGN